MSLKEKVKNALKWKKNSEYCAERLGITEEEFDKVKKEIYTEVKENKKVEREMNYSTEDCTSSFDMETGQGKISGISQTEPKSPEEIIKILNIDITQWKLSQYWNKQMSDHWRISALITKLKSDDTAHIEQLLKDWKPKKFSPVKRIESKGKKDVCAVLSLQDIHFGKQGNETIDKDFEETIMDLVERSSAGHNLKKIFYLERKVYTWGNNFFAFEHGDVNTKNSLLLYATEFAQQWGITNNRTLFTGHLHHKKKIEYITTNERTGFMLKILPSLSRTDYWHYHNKFVGSKRSGVIELHDYKKGNICELTYSPD